MKNYLIKIHKSYRFVVAICDKDIYGKKFEDNEIQMDLTNNFFNGEEINKEELIKLIKIYNQEDATFNIVGEKSIELALQTKIISKEGIKKINNIPYAFILL